MQSKPKVQSYILYKYSLVPMTLFGTVEVVTGSGNSSGSDFFYVSDSSSPNYGVTIFLAPLRPIGAEKALTITVTGRNSSNNYATDSQSDAIVISASQGEGIAVPVTVSEAVVQWKSVTSVSLDSIDYGNAGDIVELVGVDNPVADALYTNLNYITSNDITPGATLTPVPDRMEPQKVVCRVRPDHTFSISGLYVDNSSNNTLARLRGREVTLLLEMHEDGGPIVNEYVLLCSAAFSEVNLSAADNALITLSGSGTYRRMISYMP